MGRLITISLPPGRCVVSVTTNIRMEALSIRANSSKGEDAKLAAYSRKAMVVQFPKEEWVVLWPVFFGHGFLCRKLHGDPREGRVNFLGPLGGQTW